MGIKDETWQLIEDKRKLKGEQNITYRASEKAVLHETYRCLDKKVRKSARADKRRWFSDIVAQAQVAAVSHNTRETYRLTKKLMNKMCIFDRPLRSSD